MALQRPKARNSFLRPTVIQIDSQRDKLDSNQSDFRYRVLLKEQANNVINARLVRFSSGPNFMPSFYPGTAGVQAGNNKIDFSLQNFDVDSGNTANFTVTLPTQRYYYFDSTDINGDFTSMLQRLIQQKIDSNATWEDQVQVSVSTHPEQKTLITIGNSPYLPPGSTTSMTLLFGTGANKENSAATALGFAADTDYASSTSDVDFGTTSESILSPNPVNLLPSEYVDMEIAQFKNPSPFSRIYTQDLNRTSENEVSNTPTVIQTNEPPRDLRALDISFKWRGNVDPKDYIASAPHTFTLSLVQLQDWPERTPYYLNQHYYV